MSYHHHNETKDHGSDEQDVNVAIEESAATGQSVTIDFRARRAARLFEACDAEETCSIGVRYRGQDIDGREWTVILRR
jgi:hypothetical protein